MQSLRVRLQNITKLDVTLKKKQRFLFRSPLQFFARLLQSRGRRRRRKGGLSFKKRVLSSPPLASTAASETLVLFSQLPNWDELLPKNWEVLYSAAVHCWEDICCLLLSFTRVLLLFKAQAAFQRHCGLQTPFFLQLQWGRRLAFE